MATLGSTNIGTALSLLGETPIGWGESGLLVEVHRVTGGTVGDTIAITPKFITDIRTVVGGPPSTNALSTSAANTNITLTLTGSAATTVFYDVWLLGRR